VKFDAAIANAAWLATSLPEWLRFNHAARRVEATQRSLLGNYLQRNSATEFGKAHGFRAIRDYEAYAASVPTRSYDEYQHWIESIAAGSGNVLTAERVDLLEPTSGSSGAEKWVPYTRTLQAEFRRAVATWITGNFLETPGLLGGRAYWSLTPQTQRDSATTTKVPVGFDDDSAYLGGLAQRLIDRTLATSADLKSVHDMDRFWHMTLMQLLMCPDLRLISVWHPSYALLLLQHMRRNWSELLDEMQSIDVSRSRELARLGADKPTAIWPALKLISCWGDAHASGCLPDIRAEFPGVQLQPKGLVATEAFCTLPLGDVWPLAIRSHFFEFRDEHGDTHPAWMLEEGKVYSLIVTTGGGLYRYELRDRVELTGYYKDVPSLRFLGKEDNVADHFGEKLNETFVTSCLETVFERHDIEPSFAMVALDKSGSTAAYALYIESKTSLPESLGFELDGELERNPHYALCTRLGQLGPLRVVAVSAGAYDIYSQVLIKRGMRLGDVKPTTLSRLTGWSQHLGTS
jgi:hypothetical protein